MDSFLAGYRVELLGWVTSFGGLGCIYLQKRSRRIKIDFDIPYSLSRRPWIYN
jgi:hypothetical protein